MKELLEKQISEVIKSLFGLDKSVVLTIPPQKELGDFATNIALQISKEVGKKPQEVAKSISDEILRQAQENSSVNKVEIAGPGFINIFINNKNIFQEILNIDNAFGTFKQEKPQTIIVEMGDPNTHKAPHIGHLFSYLCGDSIARILIAMGHDIKKVTYRSDIGMGVSMCLYAWINDGRPDPVDLKERVLMLQKYYQKGREFYEDENEKKKIIELNNELYKKGSEVYNDWVKTKQWCMDYYQMLENSLGINSQRNYVESEVAETGMDIVKQHIGDVFVESEGAIIFPGEKYGLHNRVFITQQGTPTYEAKELGLEKMKDDDWPYDLTIIPTAHEQNDYFQVVIKAIDLALPQFKNKIKHIGFGMVSMSTGKISSRKGNGLNAITLIETIMEKIKDLINERGNIPEEEKDEVINKVAFAAIKYAFLKSNILKDMKFDIEDSVSFDGNSGPYLMYAYARIQSIIRKSSVNLENLNSDDFAKLCNSEVEKELAKKLIEYPEIVKEAADKYSPHIISNYLFELSQLFNNFYKSNTVNDENNTEVSKYRLELCNKTALVLKLGLNLIGIETVDRM